MIIKFNECHKKSMISDIITRFVQLICMVGFFISQLLGRRVLWILIGLASISAMLILIIIIKVISIYKKVYIVLDGNDLIIDNNYIKTNEIHSISMSDNFITFKIRKHKNFGINLKWINEDDKTYLIEYFKHLETN